MFIAAILVIVAAAALGLAPPALVGVEAAFLMIGGALIALAITVPVLSFALDRYSRLVHAARMQDQESNAQAMQAAREESQAMHSALSQANQEMHQQDRDTAHELARALDIQSKEVALRAKQADMDIAVAALQDSLRKDQRAAEESWSRHEKAHAQQARELAADLEAQTHALEQAELATAAVLEDVTEDLSSKIAVLQEDIDALALSVRDQWESHDRLHEDDAQRQTSVNNRSQGRLADLQGELHALQAEQAALSERLEATELVSVQSLQEARDADERIAKHLRGRVRELESRLERWQAPEGQMRDWAGRIEATVKHDLTHLRAKVHKELGAFEDREIEHLQANERRSRRDAATLAEDIARHRLESIHDDYEKRMAAYTAELEERFAAFLAGYQAQRAELEARLAAVGATRGIKVEGHGDLSVATHAPFGRIHPVHDIEGIGNKTSYALQRKGILDTEALWHADTPSLAKDLGITPRQVRQWQSQAELMAVNGIGPQLAELLAVCGVTSITHLANMHGRELIELIDRQGHLHDRSIQKGHFTAAKADDLIVRAREHTATQPIHV